MTLQQIRYVMEISRCGSIGKAAQELNLTQPYLSTTLKDLENELHISIFSRSRKGTSPHKGGRRIFAVCKDPAGTGRADPGSVYAPQRTASLPSLGFHAEISVRYESVLPIF